MKKKKKNERKKEKSQMKLYTYGKDSLFNDLFFFFTFYHMDHYTMFRHITCSMHSFGQWA